MKAKDLQIRIKTFHQGLEDFGRTFKVLQSGKTPSKQEGVFFTGLEAARNILTQNRLALLRAVKERKPRSIYAG